MSFHRKSRVYQRLLQSRSPTLHRFSLLTTDTHDYYPTLFTGVHLSKSYDRAMVVMCPVVIGPHVDQPDQATVGVPAYAQSADCAARKDPAMPLVSGCSFGTLTRRGDRAEECEGGPFSGLRDADPCSRIAATVTELTRQIGDYRLLVLVFAWKC